jgi:hypothetical protein
LYPACWGGPPKGAGQGRGDLAYQFLASNEALATANRFLADYVSVI